MLKYVRYCRNLANFRQSVADNHTGHLPWRCAEVDARLSLGCLRGICISHSGAHPEDHTNGQIIDFSHNNRPVCGHVWQACLQSPLMSCQLGMGNVGQACPHRPC